MLDRTLTPHYNPLKPIELLKPQHRTLESGAALYFIDGADAPVVRVEFIFPHARWEPEQPLASQAVSGMLLEGTGAHTAAEIAETIDFYGAFLNAESGADHTIVTLHSLNKQLGYTLPLVREVITGAVFPQHELDVYCRNSRQKLQVSMEKNEFQARKAFNRTVFGEENIYGYPAGIDDFGHISRDMLLKKHKEQFRSGNCIIIVSGNVDEATLLEIDRLFGKADWPGNSGPGARPVLKPGVPGKQFVEMPGSLQSAIRIGKPIVNKTHADHPALQVLNTALGGYFGSRLMANIREDKGYTYGIGSGLHSLKETGVFFIATEVGVEVREKALAEIYGEIERLTAELIPAEELELVRNYMLGSFLGSLENVFSHADKLKSLLLFGLDYEYYERYFETVRTVTPQRLQQLAVEYLSDGFYEVTAG